MIQLGTEVRWQDRNFEVPLERILLTEQLGFDAVFTAEGYGSEGLVPLGFIAAHTKHLKLGTRILQVTGRSPAVTVMALQTLNHLTGGGRVIAGFGSSSVMATEGMHGRKWGQQVARMRDYITLVRQGLDGEAMDHDGPEWSAPYRGPGAANLDPMRIGLEVLGPTPILIGGSGPRIIQLAAEIADGWMPPGFAPGLMPSLTPLLEEGFRRAGPDKDPTKFEIWSHVDVLVDDDVERAMRPFKEYVVTWSKMQRPFMVARGYEETADRLEELISAGTTEEAEVRLQHGGNLLEGKLWEEALATVPDEYIDEGWLVGPVERIGQRLAPWLDSGLTGLIVRYGPQLNHDRNIENLDVFRVIARAAGKEPRLP